MWALAAGTLVVMAGEATAVGPGAGPWIVGNPADHGLNSTLLEMASRAVADRVPVRYCLVVTKDGRIMHEQYYANTSTTAYETDSLAKTATALVVGAAIYAGLFELDTPMAHYGVVPACLDGSTDCWKAVSCPTGVPCPTGPNGWFPNITARHLLAQSGGCVEGEGCKYPPGTAWTYDSGQWIQHLSYLITKTANQPAIVWATENFMAKIGLPQFYLTGDGYPEDARSLEISAGGGMMVNCRDIARLGQIILDKGVVTRDDGTTERLVGADFIEAMLTPQFPARGFSYGLLTWLNAPRDPAVSPACCAPRWGPKQTCSNKRLTTSLLGDDLAGVADIAPPDVGVGMGWLGQYLYIVPSTNVSITTMGSSWGSSLQCPLGNALPTDPVYNDGYDDGYSATEVWLALNAAVAPVADATGAVPTGTGGAPATAAVAVAASAAAEPEGHVATRTDQDAAPKPASASLLNRTIVGSCACRCPPGRLTGRCYDLEADQVNAEGGGGDRCNAVVSKAGDDCPATGVTRQCHSPPRPEDTNCSAADASMRGDIGSITVWGGHLRCMLARGCSIDPEGKGLLSAGCQCQPIEYGDFGCTFSQQPCEYGAYMQPGSPI